MGGGAVLSEFYDGSQIFSPLTSIIGLPVDQINFLICQFIAITFAYVFRRHMNLDRFSSQTRHIVEITAGLSLAYFCFGREITHILMQSLMCLVLMKCLKPGIMEKVVLLTAMAYLCIGHIYRFIYDYGGYTLDITGPLMLNTQKLSSLAFAIKDGHDLENNKKLNDNLRSKVIRKFPSLLEFASYILSFHGLMCGPFCFYHDYISFIEGRNYDISSGKLVNGELQRNGILNEKKKHHKPDPNATLLNKLFWAAVFGLSTILLLPKYTINLIKGPDFDSGSVFYKLYLLILYTTFQRHKYYFAWKLGEAGNISAGFGYNGKDEYGNDRWDLLDNVDISKVEFSTSLKVLVDNWNKSTTYWLRYILYDRVKSIIPVVFFSAFWHGFYPGYYLTFCTGGLFVGTSRLARSVLRPLFQKTRTHARLYDLVTFIVTRVITAYLSFPFVVLQFWLTLHIYKQLYFCLHIGSLLLALGLIIYKKSVPKSV